MSDDCVEHFLFDDGLSLLDDIRRIVSNPRDPFLGDVTFLVGEGKVEVSSWRWLLSLRSEPFRALLMGRFKESSQSVIEIPDADPGMFSLLLKFLVCGTVEITMENALPLLSLADRYAVETLRKACGDFVLRMLSPPNALQLWCFARKYNDEDLSQRCIDVIDANGADIFDDENCLEGVPPTLVMELCKRRSLQVDEMALFTAICRWLSSRATHEKPVPAGTKMVDTTSASSEEDGDGGGVSSDTHTHASSPSSITGWDEWSNQEEFEDELWAHIRFPLIDAETIVNDVVPSHVVSSKYLLAMLSYHAAPDSCKEDLLVRWPEWFRARKCSTPRWRADTAGASALDVSSDGMTVTSSHGTWATIGLQEVWTSGKHSFSIRLDQYKTEKNRYSIVVGCCPPSLLDENYRSPLGYRGEGCGWGYICTKGKMLMESCKEATYGIDDGGLIAQAQEGSIITVRVDLDEEPSFEILVDGKSLGIIKMLIHAPLVGAVSLIKNQRVTLIRDT